MLKQIARRATVREVGGRCLDGLPPGLQFHFDRQKSWFGQHFVHESPFGRIQGSSAYFQNRYMVDTICMSDLGGTIKCKFWFLSCRPDEKLIFDQNIKKHSAESSVTGWLEVRSASRADFHFDCQKSWFGEHFAPQLQYGRDETHIFAFNDLYYANGVKVTLQKQTQTICFSIFR